MTRISVSLALVIALPIIFRAQAQESAELGADNFQVRPFGGPEEVEVSEVPLETLPGKPEPAIIEGKPEARPEPVPETAPEPAPASPKPRPAAPRPKKSRKAARKAAPKVSDTARAEAELKFLKSRFASAEDSGVLESLLAQADAYLDNHRDAKSADFVQWLRVQLLEKAGDNDAAAVGIIKLFYEYPDTDLTINAKRLLLQIVGKRMRKNKDRINEIAKGTLPGLDRPGRLAEMLRALSAVEEKALYRPLVAEFRDFMRRYPGHSAVGEMTLLLAQLHHRNGESKTGILLNRKVLDVFESRELQARAQAAIGDIYAEALRDYDKAVGAYQTVTNKFGDTDYARRAYVKMAELLNDKLKQSELAVEVLDKIVKSYPTTDAAFDALNKLADIQENRLKSSEKAVETLERLADMFPGDRAVEALDRASGVARSSKDFQSQAKLLETLASKYPENKRSPEALWEAAQIYEKRLTDPGAAMKAYEKLVDKYPTGKLAKKARKRMQSMNE